MPAWTMRRADRKDLAKLKAIPKPAANPLGSAVLLP
jgi:hypothetical protein